MRRGLGLAFLTNNTVRIRLQSSSTAVHWAPVPTCRSWRYLWSRSRVGNFSSRIFYWVKWNGFWVGENHHSKSVTMCQTFIYPSWTFIFQIKIESRRSICLNYFGGHPISTFALIHAHIHPISAILDRFDFDSDPISQNSYLLLFDRWFNLFGFLTRAQKVPILSIV